MLTNDTDSNENMNKDNIVKQPVHVGGTTHVVYKTISASIMMKENFFNIQGILSVWFIFNVIV